MIVINNSNLASCIIKQPYISVMRFYKKKNVSDKLIIIANPYQNVVVVYSSSKLTMRIRCRWMPSLLER